MPPTRRSSRLNKAVPSAATVAATDAATVAATDAAVDAATDAATVAATDAYVDAATDTDQTAEAETSAAAGAGAEASAAVDQTAGAEASQPLALRHLQPRRYHKRVSLRECPEARVVSGEDLDWSSDKLETRKRKRLSRKKKSDVRCGRGPGRPRDPVHPDSRPKLKIVGDREFTSEPLCSKITTTIRVATCECLPGPIRSFNIFPTRVRLQILRKFLQRYSWADGEDVGLCLDVFERIAADAYSRVLVQTRKKYTEKISHDKEEWKEFCPQWCKNLDHWKGLCDIFKNPNWEKSSTINRNNKLVHGKTVASHVGGSRSSYRHKLKLIAEKGTSLDLKDVFDRTHLRKESNEYVNERAKDAANNFKALKETHGNGLDDEVIWDIAVKGEDKRGRLYGFGNASRKSRKNREVEAMEATVSPTKSTATSANKKQKTFTAEEVQALLKDTLAKAQEGFAEKIADQEKRHIAELEANKAETRYRRMALDELHKRAGYQSPAFTEGTSNVEAPGGSRGNQEGGEEGNQEAGEEP
ncbi:Plant transposase (Ptta/En/Spm family) [Carex littledalei]|uniref:Plant transposase (Ptta/En/Spm family) n=1 Tax=Carex littledalei TaxID=544730 RepID=A0A833RRI9_9POAL|nr:Plant transposase (Ptta/En/Spm family) [Carex littledalei]